MSWGRFIRRSASTEDINRSADCKMHLQVDGRDKFKSNKSQSINSSEKLYERIDKKSRLLESPVSTLLLRPEQVALLFRPIEQGGTSRHSQKTSLKETYKNVLGRELDQMDHSEAASSFSATNRKTSKQRRPSTITVPRKPRQNGETLLETEPGRCDSRITVNSSDSLCAGCSPRRHCDGHSFSCKHDIGLSDLPEDKAIIDWKKSHVPPKADIHQVIYRQLTNFVCPDVTVVIGENEFFCHRMVLAGYSKWFEDPKRTGSVIQLNDVDKTAFLVAYSWMMAEGDGGLEFITRNNILDVLILSRQLQISDLEQQCLACIDSNEIFSEETAYYLFMSASKLNQNDIQELMVPRIQRFFLPLVGSKDFLNLSLKDLCILLASNYIQINCEMEVFMAAVRWLRADWKNRSVHVEKVMKCVRFGLMTPAQLVDIRKNPECSEFLEITRNKYVQTLIEDGLAYSVEQNLASNKEKHRSRCDLLKLSIPEMRNWSKKKISYRNFSDFLDRLGKIQSVYASQLAENDDLRKVTKDAVEDESGDFPRLRSCSNKKPSLLDLIQETAVPAKRLIKSSRGDRSRWARTLKETAATVIQATWRGYMARSGLPPRVTAKLKALRTKYRKKSLLVDVMLCQMYDSPRDEGEKEEEERHKDVLSSDKHARVKKSSSHESALAKMNKKKTQYSASSLYFFNDYSLLLFGGSISFADGLEGNRSNSVLRYAPERKAWLEVCSMPARRFNHCACYLKNKIYLIGGCTLNSKSMRRPEEVDFELVEETWCFDPCNRQWTNEPGMLTPRKNFMAVSLNGYIYVIGGQDRTNQLISSVERYDPVKKLWEEMSSLPEPCAGAGACAFQNSIWTAGGVKTLKPTLSSQVSCYDPNQNLWIRKPPLRFGRAFATLTAFVNTLYLSGGEKYEGNELESTDSVDIWDEKNSKWKHRATMPSPRHAHAAILSGTEMHLIGGLSTKSTSKTSICQVDTFCLKSCLWDRKIAAMPVPIVGHAGVALPPSVVQ